MRKKAKVNKIIHRNRHKAWKHTKNKIIAISLKIIYNADKKNRL